MLYDGLIVALVHKVVIAAALALSPELRLLLLPKS